MKITRTQHVAPVEPLKARQDRPPGGAPPPMDTVTLSPAAGFVDTARSAASVDPPFRSEVVADVKASLANGTFEQSVDIDGALDGLLADL